MTDTFLPIGDVVAGIMDRLTDEMPMADFFEKYAHWIIPEPMSGCWLWVGSWTTAGYGNFTRYNRTYYAHRSAYEATHGTGSAKGLFVRHHCDNPCCVNPSHLGIGTAKDNSQDAVRRGRVSRLFGERSPKATIRDADAIRIAEMARSGLNATEIAAKTGFRRKTIYGVLDGTNFSHLPVCVPDRPRGQGKPPQKRGSEVWNSKLNEMAVRDIKRRLASGETGRSIARCLGVTPATISSINVGRLWSHV